MWSLGSGKSRRHTCSSFVAKSKIGSEGETSHKPWSRCASVNIFILYGWYFKLLSWTISLSPFLSLDMGYLFLSFFSLNTWTFMCPILFFWILWTFICPISFFSSCFLKHVFYLFLHSPCPFSWNDNLERVVMNKMEFYLLGWNWMDGWNVLMQLRV